MIVVSVISITAAAAVGGFIKSVFPIKQRPGIHGTVSGVDAAIGLGG